MTKYGRSGLSLEHEAEMERLIKEWLETYDGINDDVEDYLRRYGSKEFNIAREKRNKYVDNMYAKGIIVN